ncbi:uncharacterized protein PAN0_003d2091 [Moesziomyces antarcticus]|uniref:Uncharacterized protein n=1 Tax=Pseudozyma antarctica TaxID=84753 RepID=A0A5C3FJW5_PSEA2|nr:uncharacterized protein PAN0_003d2091 [Moesziomyces antarcticus]GAK63882.1 conserved hypothetical protein [Moesziomyces antarcticus]SPO44490.1 uncharacterized protein PSANT_02175 [Moesziomyces antarcticus]
MRLLTSRLLVATIVLLLLAASCQASVSTGHQSHDIFDVAPSSRHLSKRVDEETVASAWSKAQVPERLRNWKIFQDGGGFRETIRKGYIGFLRKLDKLHEPYPEFRHIKKEWIYEKDLRQHYVLPRVLRIPAITQETAIPNLKPFVAALKDADSELKLNTEARERVPNLSEHLDEKEAEATAAESDAQPSNKKNAGTDTSQDISGSPQRGSRRRKPRRFNRLNSFQQFRPAEPSAEQPPLSQASSLQRSEIQSEASSARGSVDQPERAATPVQEEANADREADKQPSAMRRFRDSIMKFQDRFERIKKFRDDQIGKASLHYQAPTQAFAPHSVLSPEEIGLNPVRLPTIRSGDSSLENTPRVDDGKGNEADVSNSVSPALRNNDPFGQSSGLHRSGSVESQWNGKTDPSPPLSPYQSSTPRYGGRTGTQTPGEPGLPYDYAEILHAARVRHGFVQRMHNPADASKQSLWRGSERAGSGSETASESGLGDSPSRSAIQRMQEEADKHNIGYVVYDGPTSPGVRTPRSPVSDAEVFPARSVSPQPQPAVNPRTDSRPRVAAAGRRARTKGIARPANLGSLSVPPRFDTGQKSLPGVDPLPGVESPSAEGAPAAKRKRPDPLGDPSSSPSPKGFVGFGPPPGELPSPQFPGFRRSIPGKDQPSVASNVASNRPNTSPNPIMDPTVPASVVFRRQRLQNLVRTDPNYLSKLRGSTVAASEANIRMAREPNAARSGRDSPDLSRAPTFPPRTMPTQQD